MADTRQTTGTFWGRLRTILSVLLGWRGLEPPLSAPPPLLASPRVNSIPPSDKFIRLCHRLVLDKTTGMLTLLSKGVTLIDKASATVTYRVAGTSHRLSTAGAGLRYCIRYSTMRLSREDDYLRLQWYVSWEPRPEIYLEVRNISHLPVQVDQLRVLELDAGAGGRLGLEAAPRRWTFYQHGWTSSTPTLGRRVGPSVYEVPKDPGYLSAHFPHGVSEETNVMTSEWMTVLWGRGRSGAYAGVRGLLVGFITAADYLSEIRLGVDVEAFRFLEAVCYADGVTLQPGQVLRSERLIIDHGDDPLVLLEMYADLLGKHMAARRPSCIPTGWSPWHYFFGQNSEQEIFENLAEMRQEKLPLDYVLLEDGYQKAIGDWFAPAEGKYTDLKTIAEVIHEGGRRAGIWVAPFGLAANSEVYQNHPDWVVRDDNGLPVVAWQHAGQDIYALDLSHPNVHPWLAHIFRIMRQDWGYELFKIDHLFAACIVGRRHNPNMTRAQALRRGLQIIREAIGDDAFLWGCDAPQAPCVGMIDGMSVAPEMAANWHPFFPDMSMPSAANALRNSIARYFTHRRLWINHPGCILVRERGDVSDLVFSEMRTVVGAAALLGGATFSGDHLPALRKGRLKYLEQMLPPTGISARPLDLFSNELPQCLALPVRRPFGEWLVVGIMNWQDRILSSEVNLEALGLPAGRYHVFNYWPRKYMGITDQTVTIDRHLPHEMVILLFKAVRDQPELLTTTFHVAQTLSEVQSVECIASPSLTTLTIYLERVGDAAGEVWFTFPDVLKIQNAWVGGRKRKVGSEGVGVAHIGLTLSGPTTIKIDFVPTD